MLLAQQARQTRRRTHPRDFGASWYFYQERPSPRESDRAHLPHQELLVYRQPERASRRRPFATLLTTTASVACCRTIRASCAACRCTAPGVMALPPGLGSQACRPQTALAKLRRTQTRQTPAAQASNAAPVEMQPRRSGCVDTTDTRHRGHRNHLGGPFDGARTCSVLRIGHQWPSILTPSAGQLTNLSRKRGPMTQSASAHPAACQPDMVDAPASSLATRGASETRHSWAAPSTPWASHTETSEQKTRAAQVPPVRRRPCPNGGETVAQKNISCGSNTSGQQLLRMTMTFSTPVNKNHAACACPAPLSNKEGVCHG